MHPRKGAFFQANFQYAGGIFGGTAGDWKTQPEVRAYVPFAPAITLATRASVGFLFPRNYGDVVQYQLDEDVTGENRAARSKDIQTVLFRGFYSGGPSSNRGYPIRAVSPHGIIPFLNPLTAAQQVASRLRRDSTPIAASAPFPSGASRCGNSRPKFVSS